MEVNVDEKVMVCNDDGSEPPIKTEKNRNTSGKYFSKLNFKILINDSVID